MDAVQTIRQLFQERGASEYGGEPVSQLEHALQTANLAVVNGATDALVVAALLHDIGHLLHSPVEMSARSAKDVHHEVVGYRFLARYFDHYVVEPLRLHVAAKRYLCAVNDQYVAGLSPASRRSLALQGGPMSEREAASFASGPYALDAIVLRRWDDDAKSPGLEVAPLETYVPYIERMLTHR
jgi:[1-hydroxy-2-(trimethylamino)ethyl]phosphonate dioxygenase